MPTASIQITNVVFNSGTNNLNVRGICVFNAASDNLVLSAYALSNNATAVAGPTSFPGQTTANFALDLPNFTNKSDGYYVIHASVQDTNGAQIASCAVPYYHTVPVAGLATVQAPTPGGGPQIA